MANFRAKRLLTVFIAAVMALQSPATIALAEQQDMAYETYDMSSFDEYYDYGTDSIYGADTSYGDEYLMPENTSMSEPSMQDLEEVPSQDYLDVIPQDPSEEVMTSAEENQTAEIEVEAESAFVPDFSVEAVGVDVQAASTPALDCNFVQSCERELAAWPTGVTREKWDCKYWVGPDPDSYTNVDPVDPEKGGHWGYWTWCSEFVGWNLWNVGLKPGKTMPWQPWRSVEYYDFYKQHPELAEIHENDGTYTPRNGDIVLFGSITELNHTEMISRVAAGGKSWTGVSGGTSLTRTSQKVSNKSVRFFVSINWRKAGAAYAVDTSVPISNVTVSAVGDRPYSGKAITPKPTVTYGFGTLQEGRDYTLRYSNNVKAGTASITIDGKGNYYGSRTVSFVIRKATKSNPVVSYCTHVQNKGWKKYVKNGKVSGSTGKGKRIEAIRIKLSSKPYEGSIQYRSYVQKKGWEKKWKKNGATSGTTGKGRRIEAIRIKLAGVMAEEFDVYYRVRAEHFGWMGWAKNGAKAGSTRYGRRLEAIQIIIVPKGQSSPTATYGGVRQHTAAAYKQKKK